MAKRKDEVPSDLKEEIKFLHEEEFLRIFVDGNTLTKDELDEIIKESQRYHVDFNKKDVRKAIQDLYSELLNEYIAESHSFYFLTHNDLLRDIISESLESISSNMSMVSHGNTDITLQIAEHLVELMPDELIDVINYSRNDYFDKLGFIEVYIKVANTKFDVKRSKELCQNIVDRLLENDFKVEWDGSCFSEITIKGFIWQERIPFDENYNIFDNTSDSISNVVSLQEFEAKRI